LLAADEYECPRMRINGRRCTPIHADKNPNIARVSRGAGFEITSVASQIVGKRSGDSRRTMRLSVSSAMPRLNSARRFEIDPGSKLVLGYLRRSSSRRKRNCLICVHRRVSAALRRLLVSQRLGRIQSRGAVCRQDSEQKAHQQRHSERHHDRER
jgi:hypothetical protein